MPRGDFYPTTQWHISSYTHIPNGSEEARVSADSYFQFSASNVPSGFPQQLSEQPHASWLQTPLAGVPLPLPNNTANSAYIPFSNEFTEYLQPPATTYVGVQSPAFRSPELSAPLPPELPLSIHKMNEIEFDLNNFQQPDSPLHQAQDSIHTTRSAETGSTNSSHLIPMLLRLLSEKDGTLIFTPLPLHD